MEIIELEHGNYLMNDLIDTDKMIFFFMTLNRQQNLIKQASSFSHVKV